MPIRENTEAKHTLAEITGQEKPNNKIKLESSTKIAEKPSPNKTDIKSKPLKEDGPPKETKTTGSYLSADEQELLLRDGAHFVLQWVAISKLEDAGSYSQSHQLRDKIKIYRRSNSNSVLFLVVSDDFASRGEAERAKDDYKRNGVGGEPWVKSLKLVKKEIKAFQRTAP